MLFQKLNIQKKPEDCFPSSLGKVLHLSDSFFAALQLSHQPCSYWQEGTFTLLLQVIKVYVHRLKDAQDAQLRAPSCGSVRRYQQVTELVHLFSVHCVMQSFPIWVCIMGVHLQSEIYSFVWDQLASRLAHPLFSFQVGNRTKCSL